MWRSRQCVYIGRLIVRRAEGRAVGTRHPQSSSVRDALRRRTRTAQAAPGHRLRGWVSAWAGHHQQHPHSAVHQESLTTSYTSYTTLTHTPIHTHTHPYTHIHSHTYTLIQSVVIFSFILRFCLSLELLLLHVLLIS